MIDGGDAHLTWGSDVCAQALHVADVYAMCVSGALQQRKAYKSLSPHPEPLPLRGGGGGRGGGVGVGVGGSGGGGGSMSAVSGGSNWSSLAASSARAFKCVRHVLKQREIEAWRAILEPHLGVAPKAIFSYSGRGELFATRAAITSLPRETYAILLGTLLSRTSPHADALTQLLPRVWGALLGGTFTRQSGFECDHARGWGTMREALEPAAAREAAAASGGGVTTASVPPAAASSALLPRLRPPSFLPHPTRAGVEAALAVAPLSPSGRERATQCGASSLMCVVIAAHKESLTWVTMLRSQGYPTLVYTRTR